ncbi:UDP-N-acetylmuramoyl-tripeptide--D-alanyl-D-alanine ligase [Superficieibacter sp.]|uniref:UDP-N-acetylmuramoyl-tripeptide--D-alanyl-D- alanine ligase n=1 Tax=Superficieibacter sp. TaxID=2303322 RepID=UPI0028AF5224|nr:UDP-N-acetylmuramoyl-tripeptide--D-alanyl-D-alanine ligase [Superficieibacter sp.]
MGEQMTQAAEELPAFWTAKDVEQATAGSWFRPPSPGWAATGLSIFAPAMQPGNMALVRSATDNCGMLASVVARMAVPPACIITTDPQQIKQPDIPVFQVADGTEALLAMGRYARDRLRGNVIGVTGSAGKTTCVAMLARALSAWGAVGQSAHNANLPRGVAWNLASIAWDTPNVVIEMAIGRMGVSARMARPQVAVFTNIQPAHLGEKHTLRDIAVTKSAIFWGMAAGATAILNRDMAEFETVRDEALRRKLIIMTYGCHPESDSRLLHYDADGHQVQAQIGGQTLNYTLAAAGEHMAINSLAVLTAVSVLHYPLTPAIEMLTSFMPLAGRGREIAVEINGCAFTLIDDAYNANPGSMNAALASLSDARPAGRRLAILGEMADLGSEAVNYHTALAPVINDSNIDRVYMVGESYRACWQALNDNKKGRYFDSIDALKAELLSQLRSGDRLLMKGSHSANIHQLVDWIVAQNQPGSRPA